MSFIVRSAGVVAIAGAALLGSTATAAAEPPNCTLADMSGVLSGVSAGMSRFLRPVLRRPTLSRSSSDT